MSRSKGSIHSQAWRSRLAAAGLCLLVACGEPAVGQQVEAGVLDVIDLGFDDAGAEDGGAADAVAPTDGCAGDGTCG